jgi:DHA2 family methylenomycin A resistance protein-like MFS transporter
MCAGMFLVLLDVTVVNVAIPAISTGLRTDTAGVQWVVDAYPVALASLLLGGGTLADRIGHRSVVLAGLAVFAAASAACALAPTAGVLVAARAGKGSAARCCFRAVSPRLPTPSPAGRSRPGHWASGPACRRWRCRPVHC